MTCCGTQPFFKNLRFERGQTYSFTETVRDAMTGRPVDLSTYELYLGVRANIKALPDVMLTSRFQASLQLGLHATNLNSVVRAKSDGNNILVSTVADDPGGVTINETLVTAGLSIVNKLVTIHFKPTVSTVADVEAALVAQGTLLEIATSGTGGNILTSPADVMTNIPLVTGALDDWRTGIVKAVQSGATLGQYTVTFIPADTVSLVAMGSDDPWIYDVWMSDGTDKHPVIFVSNVALDPQSTIVP